MARWEPDARGRLRIAALELYAERGYERTTVADIAERASVTERTYFRHFADKREVLFDGSNQMQDAVAAAVEGAPASETPFEVAARAVVEGTVLLDERRAYATTRARVIAAEPSLRERELLKMSNLTATIADGLSRRGVDAVSARLAAHAAITAFSVGFETWTASDDGRPIADHIREALEAWPRVVSG